MIKALHHQHDRGMHLFVLWDTTRNRAVTRAFTRGDIVRILEEDYGCERAHRVVEAAQDRSLEETLAIAGVSAKRLESMMTPGPGLM